MHHTIAWCLGGTRSSASHRGSLQHVAARCTRLVIAALVPLAIDVAALAAEPHVIGAILRAEFITAGKLKIIQAATATHAVGDALLRGRLGRGDSGACGEGLSLGIAADPPCARIGVPMAAAITEEATDGHGIAAEIAATAHALHGDGAARDGAARGSGRGRGASGAIDMGAAADLPFAGVGLDGVAHVGPDATGADAALAGVLVRDGHVQLHIHVLGQ